MRATSTWAEHHPEAPFGCIHKLGALFVGAPLVVGSALILTAPDFDSQNQISSFKNSCFQTSSLKFKTGYMGPALRASWHFCARTAASIGDLDIVPRTLYSLHASRRLASFITTLHVCELIILAPRWESCDARLVKVPAAQREQPIPAAWALLARFVAKALLSFDQ